MKRSLPGKERRQKK